jgi:hypothetical protein
MRGDRLVEVYGRRFEGDRLCWIGYSEKKPDQAWCDQHVSTMTGAFQSVAWSAEHAGWVITFAGVAAVGEEEPAACAPLSGEPTKWS